MAHEVNRNGRYYCDRLGAACDFRIVGLESDRLVDWILEQQLPFDSLYYYGGVQPIHISYAPQQYGLPLHSVQLATEMLTWLEQP